MLSLQAAVIIHEHGYNRNNDGIVWKCANIVYTHATLNTHEPIITTIVGTIVLPSPLDAAIVQSINEDTAYDKPLIIILCIPASITSGSLVNNDRNCLPNIIRSPPSIAAAKKA